MKHYELEIEHHFKNKFIGRTRLRPSSKPVILGGARDAHIRLLGDDVSQIHAYVEYQDGCWVISDANSQQGTWLNKKPLTNEKLAEPITVSIGGHTLKLTPHVFEKEVFTKEQMMSRPTSGTKSHHQVVIRRGDRVLRSELLSPDQPYILTAGGQDHTLAAPVGEQVLENEICGYTIYQRLVRADDMNLTAQDFFKSIKSPEMRTPILAALIMLFFITALIVAIPKKPTSELAEMSPNNQYTRMIYDAEHVKKRRAEAREMRKTISRSAPAAPEQKNVVTTPVKSKGATPKVVSNLKLEGLNALMGKIAKRANTKGPMINAIGKTADQQGTGAVTTVAAVGSLQGVATQAGNGGETFKVGGVGTLGKGSGGRGVAGLGGLAAGGVGSGTVGILDEETEIEGGLDKEVIARVIAGYLGEIRYCYERQLSADPDIYGKVQVKFTIDPDGRVAEHRVGATTLKSAMVEGCILRRLARWKFPKPKGGTHVLVTYPFMFKATN